MKSPSIFMHLLIGLLTINVYAQDTLFLPAVTYPVGSFPRSIFASDLDGDGDDDLAVANYYTDYITVLLNTGNGRFQDSIHYRSAGCAQEIYAIDLDGDMDNDLATADYCTHKVSIFMNNGDGSFLPAVHYPAGPWTSSIFAGDFDGDEDNDIAAGTDNGTCILRNNGNGTFQEAEYLNNGTPSAVWGCDLNSDLNIDLVVSSDGYHIAVLMNEGETFSEPVLYETPASPNSIYGCNLDSDQDNDLITANWASGTVSVFRNDGDGIFQEAENYSVGSYANCVFAADLDVDGDNDLAVAVGGRDSICILLNNGAAVFQVQGKYAAGNEPASIIAADLDRDGDNDLAVSNNASGDVSILLNNSIIGPVSGSRLVIENLTIEPNPPTHAEDAIISFNIKNIGNEVWHGRQLVVSIIVADMLNQGPNDSFWIRELELPGQVRQHDFKPISTMPDLAPDEYSSLNINFKFKAPDYSDELIIEIFSATEGSRIDSFQDSTLDIYYNLSVNVNESAYVNCMGELLTAVNCGIAGNLFRCYARLTKLFFWDYNLAGIYGPEEETLFDRLTNPDNHEVDFIDIGLKTLKYAVNTANLFDTKIAQTGLCDGQALLTRAGFILSIIAAAFDEFNGNGCGVALAHEKTKLRNLLLGMCKEIASLPIPGGGFYLFMIGCPAELQVINANGDTAWVHMNTIVENNIEGGFAFPAGDSVKAILTPNNSAFQMKIIGKDNGTANISIIRAMGNGTGDVIYFSNIPVGPVSVAVFSIDTNTTTYTLFIDFDGDGTYENSATPDSVEAVINQGLCNYIPGDVNYSGEFNGIDVSYAVSYLKGGPVPPYLCNCDGSEWYVAGDVNGSCSFNGIDITYMVTYFKGGSPPVPCSSCTPGR